MKKISMFFLALFVGTGLVLGSFSSAGAQNADEFMLEEITVTAQKREQNQQDVPIAMEVISGEDAQELGWNDVEEFFTNVSSVLINKASDGLRISIRGVSDDLPEFKNTQASTPTVAVNKDGVFTNRKNSGQDLFDLERVEVLFGPQSTLYATASPGGVVNVVTGSPKLDDYQGSATIEAGNYGLLHTEGVANVPVSETVAVRAAFTTTSREGYLTNGADDEDTKAGRLRVLYQPKEDLSFLFSTEFSRSNGTGIADVEAFDDESETSNPWTSADEGNPATGYEEQLKIYANIDWALGIGGLSIVPSYSERDAWQTETAADFMTEEMVTTDTSADGYEKGIEARLASNESSPFEWIVGANIYKSRDASSGEGDDGSWNWTWNVQETEAIYGNMTYPISDRFRATVGGRYTWEENNAETSKYPDAEAETTGNWIQDVQMKYDGMDYKLGVEYDLNENSMLYADFSTSYRTQGVNFQSSGESFPPEELDAYSIGSKNRFFDNKLQINASIYYYDYTNYMPECPPVATLDQVDLNGDGDTDDTNQWSEEDQTYRDETISYDDPNAKAVGDLEIIGFDLQTTLIISNNDKLDMSVSYVHKEFSDLVFDFLEQTNALGVEDLDYTGEGSTNSPEWTVTLGYSHNFSLPNGGALTARFDTKYQSEYFLTWQDKTVGLDLTTYEPTVSYVGDVRIQEAYHVSNVTLVYNNPDGKWTLTGYVKNIEDYAVKRSYLSESLVIGPPLTYGAILSVRF